jgi:hypothetical protein
MPKRTNGDFYHHGAETMETLTEPRVLLNKWHEVVACPHSLYHLQS